MTLPEMRYLCVDSFVQPQSRLLLFERLSIFLDVVRSTVGSCEVWIDGSFVTTKPNPNDVDILVLLPSNAVFAESDVLILLHQARTKYQCDAYIVENTIELRSYWRGWFCFDRQERAKGIIQVML